MGQISHAALGGQTAVRPRGLRDVKHPLAWNIFNFRTVAAGGYIVTANLFERLSAPYRPGLAAPLGERGVEFMHKKPPK